VAAPPAGDEDKAPASPLIPEKGIGFEWSAGTAIFSVSNPTIILLVLDAPSPRQKVMMELGIFTLAQGMLHLEGAVGSSPVQSDAGVKEQDLQLSSSFSLAQAFPDAAGWVAARKPLQGPLEALVAKLKISAEDNRDPDRQRLAKAWLPEIQALLPASSSSSSSSSPSSSSSSGSKREEKDERPSPPGGPTQKREEPAPPGGPTQKREEPAPPGGPTS